MAKVRILLVENDNRYRSSLAAYLRNKGYEVFEAGSPEDAVSEMHKHLVHLAIVDNRLRNDDDPNDRSGLEFCRNDLDPATARIMLTGFPEWDLVREAFKPTAARTRSVDGFFDKISDDAPLSLLATIGQVLEVECDVIPERRVAVLTSGGDSPGMNAALWAVVRAGLQKRIEVFAIRDGFAGLTRGDIYKLRWKDVGDIMALGGTVIGSSRCPNFTNPATLEKAAANLTQRHISGLVVIGGESSMQDAVTLAADVRKRCGTFQTVGIPATIDNDIYGTDLSVGATTAANSLIDEFRKMIRPAEPMRRIVVVEVMGRFAGYLALQAALGIGADAVLIPEEIVEPSDKNATIDEFRNKLREAAETLKGAFEAGKRHGFVVLAEGVRLATEPDFTLDPCKFLTEVIKRWGIPNAPDVCRQELGYPPRWVAPCCTDIWLGAELGLSAIEALTSGKDAVMVGWRDNAGVISISFGQVLEMGKMLPKDRWLTNDKWRRLAVLQRVLTRPPSKLF